MKKRWLQALVVCLLFCLLLPLSLPVLHAEEASPTPPLDEVAAAYLYHFERDSAVLQKNETTAMGAGSTVKIMAGLLLCEELAPHLNEPIEITKKLLSSVPADPGFSLAITEGDRFTAEQLLYTAICGSFNNAYYLLAAHAYGSVEELLRRMNLRAADLGAADTVYRDITGIQPGSQTTARDLSLIASEAYGNDLYMKLCDTESYALSTKEISRTVYNRNALISHRGGTVTKYYDSNCYGMSAGTTPEDGNCVVTVAKHGDATYICVALGGEETETEEFGYTVIKRMIQWVFATYTYIEVISPDREIWKIPVTVSDLVSEIPLRTNEAYSAYLPRSTDLEKEITYSIRLEKESLEAPIKEETFVGYVAIVYQGKTLKTLPLYTAGSAERSSFVGTLKWMQDLFKNRAFVAGALFFVITLSAWIITESVITRRKRHRWDRYFSDKIEFPRKQQAVAPREAKKKNADHKKFRK